MSDDLDIRGGGVVAIDTATLHAAAGRFTRLGHELDEIAVLVGCAGSLVFSAAHIEWDAAASIEVVRRRVLAGSERAHVLAGDLREAAAIYEMVELRAERAAAEAAGHTGAVRVIDARIAGIAGQHPDAAARAARGEFGHWLSWPMERARQASYAPWWLNPSIGPMGAPMVWGMQGVIGAVGVGRLARTTRLTGEPHNVVVTPVRREGPPAVAPASLRAAVTRIPGGDEARIRVEKYTMPDGSRQFAVYVAGTQTVAANTTDPFDMASNVELYSGQRSASYDATLAALEAAGAEPGDAVHGFGHSQGAMIISHVALEAGYETPTLVTVGSPVEADVSPDTLSVSLRHRDDPVAALSGGGHVGAVGSPGSFVAERTADPSADIHDAQLPAHRLEGYLDTAEMLDASHDPRMGAVRSVFEELEGAASIEVLEYSAERVPTSSSGSSWDESRSRTPS